MKTADLIAALASPSEGTTATPPSPVTGAIVLAIVIGAVTAGGILLLWLGMRPMAEAIRTGAFWMKAAYSVALAATGFLVTRRLARPGGRLGRAPLLAVAAVVILAILAVARMAHAEPGQTRALLMGHTWRDCPIRILVLAAPVFAAACLALRRLAPTRLALAGAAAGLLAGGVAATVYEFYCDETTAPFVLIWYTLGIGACALVGAILGPRLLRW
ncbi:MAG: DUF1109 domain-containing protein [Caulobacteraceae bacterium]